MSKFADIRSAVKYRRKHLKSFDDAYISNGSDMSDALRYFYRTDDVGLIKDKMIQRYAMKLIKGYDEVTGAETASWDRLSSNVAKVNQGQRNAILQGQQEIIALSTYSVIVSQQATVLDTRYSRFSYEDADVESEINDIRTEAGTDLAMMQWDSIACAIDSCVLYLSVSGTKLLEQPLPPDRVWIVHARSIYTDEGEEPVDYSDIDQATVVVIRFDSVGGGKNSRYAAWFGPSDKYPLGRCVQYEGDSWDHIPDIGEKGATDYVQSGAWVNDAAIDEVANPLHLIGDDNQMYVPVYPIVILRGNPMRRGLLPTSSSLYDNCLEMSVMASIIFGAAGRSARGIQALSQTAGGTANNISNWTEGPILLTQGLTLAQAGWSAVNSKDAGEVFDGFMRRLAEDNHVPEYLVSRSGSSEIPSGVALQLMLEPTNAYRNKRIMSARPAIARRWALEKALIASVDDSIIPIDAAESWHPGEISAPIDRATLVQEWATRIDKNMGDLADAIKDLESLDTREKAINWLEQHENDAEKYPFLKGGTSQQPQQQTFSSSLFGGGLRNMQPSNAAR